MLKKLVKTFAGDPQRKVIKTYLPLVERINALEPTYEKYSDEALRAQTLAFRRRLAAGETLDDILPEAFAVVREASKRTIGLRHYDVQLIGGVVLHQGKVAEMKTGEGKTLVATLPIYLNALALNPAWEEAARERWGDDPEQWEFVPLDDIPVGRGVHLVTVNDYLARRDARWMAPIYDLLGLSIGVLQMASRTEHGKKAFLVDLNKTSPQEDQHQLRMVPRREAYNADITYGTNNEFGFDYLRDNMAMRLEDRVQRGHAYAIIDEVDNVLIDEARTPLIISGPASEATEWYKRMAQIVRQLRPDEDVEISERDRTVTLTETGEAKVEALLGEPLRDPERPEDLTPHQEELWGYLEQALRAQFLFKKNKDYLVQAGKVIIIDEHTGRLMPGRRWSDGLHQAVEAKEGVRIQPENITYATITIQNYFRMYDKLAGMTGTAATESEEFDEIYHLEVVVIPTNLEYNATGPNAPLVALEANDEEGYRYTYYARRDDPERKPLYYKRKDYHDVIYRTEEAKFRAVVREILRFHTQGRPLLVGTTSVELSERLSRRLNAQMVRRLVQVLLLRAAFLEARDEAEGIMHEELKTLYRPLEQIKDGDLRAFIRQHHLNIPLNPEKPENLERLKTLLYPTPTEQSRWETSRERLLEVMRAGVPHQVLNARKHAEESQIIAGAGAYGAVTIATNMAGRGVDIKLGGELAEEIRAAVVRVLKRAGFPDPYDMSLDAQYQALQSLDPEQYGIYDAEIRYFLEYVEQMHQVRELGGLHVIGSERHESRRIDNQLRGRAARQGDPGSSRFFLSLEDELVRRFGGEQLDAVMRRFRMDDMVPLEHPLVNKVIEQAQTRVEGYNFDQRKHTLEYDDVLNKQRAQIYAQRDRIFVKDDLREDVTELLRQEIERRVPEALQAESGPWRLLAYLEDVQPTLRLARGYYPSFTLQLVLDTFPDEAFTDPQTAEQTLLQAAREATEAEHEHIRDYLRRRLEGLLEAYERALDERQTALEELIENFDGFIEATSAQPQALRAEIETVLRIPIKATHAEIRRWMDDPDLAYETLLDLIEDTLGTVTLRRMLGTVQRAVGEIDLSLDALMQMEDWDSIMQAIFAAVENVLQQRIVRLFGDGQTEGQVGRDVKQYLNRLESRFRAADPEHDEAGLTEDDMIALLVAIQQGTRTVFDRKTHRRQQQAITRFQYTFSAARLIENRPTDALTEQVLEHLQGAQEAIQWDLGESEFQRLRAVPPSQLGARAQRGLRNALGAEVYQQYENTPLGEFPEDYHETIQFELGRQRLTERYRQLLLHVISGAWVEYLTKIEALRIAIGLEAYAQRDPLVQYKGKAHELYQELLRDIRAGVITRMFVFQGGAQVEVSSLPKASDASAAPAPSTDETTNTQGKSKKKKKKRRHRKKR